MSSSFGIVIPPALFLLFTIDLATQGFLHFHTNFNIIFSNSENIIWIFIGITLNLMITFDNLNILTMLILPIQIWCLLLLSLMFCIFFFIFHILGKIYSKRFEFVCLFFCTIMNETDVVGSFSAMELSVYTKTIDLCMSVLQSAVLPNSIMSSSRLLIESFGSPI